MPTLSSSLLEFTIEALEARLRELGQDRDRLDKQIAETTDVIRQWRANLRNLENGSTAKDTDSRRKRGENPRIVYEFFAKNPGQFFTIPEIVKGTGLQNGSVHNVLKKGNSEYEKDISGKWKLRSSDHEVLENGASAVGT